MQYIYILNETINFKKGDSALEEIKRCSRCILPSSLPSVKLDEKGVCNYCNNFDRSFGDWDNVKELKKEQFGQIIEKVKKLNREYDCLIPLSGGKDSTYALYLCDKVYKLKCLCITFDNGFLSDYARKNIKNAINATKADHIYYAVNPKTMLELYKHFILKCGHVCVPCMRGIGLVSSFPLESFNIPIVITGNGRRISYLSGFPELFQSGDLKLYQKVHSEMETGNVCTALSSHETRVNYKSYINAALNLLGIRDKFVPKYITPSYIGIYDYLDSNYKEILETINREMGWEKAGDSFEHTDCFLHEIPFFIHTAKFPELTRFTFYHSNLIRLGQMTREEAMKLETEELEKPQVVQGLDEFLEQIDMSKDEFTEEVKDWTKIQKYRKEEPLHVKAYLKLRK